MALKSELGQNENWKFKILWKKLTNYIRTCLDIFNFYISITLNQNQTCALQLAWTELIKAHLIIFHVDFICDCDFFSQEE